MAASTMTLSGPSSLRVARDAFAKSFAVAIFALALLAPTCCLTGAHAHGDGIDGFGKICFSRR
jgi:hypothetical protein